MAKYTRRVDIPGKSSDELFDTVSGEIESFLKKLLSSGKYELEKDADKKEFRFKASLFSGKLSCKDSCLELNANLSLLALPFRSKIDEGVDRWVAKVTGPKIS